MTDMAKRVLSQIRREEVLDLEQACVRIPSNSYEEQRLADFLAHRMEELGLEVSMMDVQDPRHPELTTRQPLGRLRGLRGDPVLMFNGHMDHNPLIGTWDRDPFSGDYEEGWVYGRGSLDEKGGLVAAIAAVRALQRAGASLDGDILIAPVAAHKKDGVGTRTLIEKGIRPTYFINTETTGTEIIRACVGLVRVRISTYNQPIHFHSLPALRERFFNPIEQLAAVILALGTSHTTPGWLRYEPDSDLPDFPQAGFLDFHSSYRKNGWCHLDFQVRTVPGVTRETVQRDLGEVIGRLKAQYPKLEVRLDWDPLDIPPMSTPADHPLVTSLERAYRLVTGKEPITGSRSRLGSVGDAQMYSAIGVPSVLFGPGMSEVFDQWPAPNERIWLDEIVVAARTMALAALELVGTPA